MSSIVYSLLPVVCSYAVGSLSVWFAGYVMSQSQEPAQVIDANAPLQKLLLPVDLL